MNSAARSSPTPSLHSCWLSRRFSLGRSGASSSFVSGDDGSGLQVSKRRSNFRREPLPSRSRRRACPRFAQIPRSEEHTSELQSRFDLVCRLLLEKKIFLSYSKLVRIPQSCFVKGKLLQTKSLSLCIMITSVQINIEFSRYDSDCRWLLPTINHLL